MEAILRTFQVIRPHLHSLEQTQTQTAKLKKLQANLQVNQQSTMLRDLGPSNPTEGTINDELPTEIKTIIEMTLQKILLSSSTTVPQQALQNKQHEKQQPNMMKNPNNLSTRKTIAMEEQTFSTTSVTLVSNTLLSANPTANARTPFLFD